MRPTQVKGGPRISVRYKSRFVLTRIVIAALGIPVILATNYWRGGEFFWVFGAIVGLGGVWELSRALNAAGRDHSPVWPMAAVACLLLGASLPNGSFPTVPALIGIYLSSLAVETLHRQPMPWTRVSNALATSAWPALAAVPLALRLRPPGGSHDGSAWILTALLLVWAADSGAYFAGHLFGRRKLAPTLSPGKTWEGAIGGLILSTLVGGAIARFMAPEMFPHGTPSELILGILVGIGSPIGDLVGSGIKRELGIKDFGGWLPGHGGILDRFDSFLFVCPILYAWAAVMS